MDKTEDCREPMSYTMLGSVEFSSKWTREKIIGLIRFWNENMSIEDLSVSLKLPKKHIRDQISYLRELEQRVNKKKSKYSRQEPHTDLKIHREKKLRKCLYCCPKTFMSLHKGNRICPSCKPIVERLSSISI